MATKKGTVEAAENKKTVKAGSPVVDKKETAEKKEDCCSEEENDRKKDGGCQDGSLYSVCR